jgi:hypothetical protein
MDTGKPRKTCVEVAGRRTFRTLPNIKIYLQGKQCEDIDCIHLGQDIDKGRAVVNPALNISLFL